jgi:predicted transcriptional regulator
MELVMNTGETELHRQLEFLQRIATDWLNRTDLKREFGVTDTTIHRWLTDLRHYGADIVSMNRGKNRHAYVVVNWEEIGPMVNRWLELEREKEREFGRLLEVGEGNDR